MAEKKTPVLEEPGATLAPPVTTRDFGDVAAIRQSTFDNVLQSFGRRYPISNERYTLELADLKYRAPKDFSIADQKQAIMRGRTLGWNLMGRWRLRDNTTKKVIDESKQQLIAQVPYLTGRGTYIFNGSEYTIANQMRLRPGVYNRVKENGLIESHFNVKGGTGPSFRVYMEPDTGIFRMQVGQATLKLYPLLRAMGIDDRQLGQAWGRELLQANVAATDPRAVQRAHAKLVLPRMEKAAAAYGKHPKLAVNYVEHGLLQQCGQCQYFLEPNSCQLVQGFVSYTGWCILWNTPLYKTAQETDEDENRRRVQWVGTVVCDDSKPEKPWIYLKVHRGLPEAAFEALKEQGVDAEPRFDQPHITISQREETKELVDKYGKKWKTACGHGRRVLFSLQNASVDLTPEGWPDMDRVWFLEVRSPQLRAFRKSLGLPELYQGEEREHQFHITFAVKPKTDQRKHAPNSSQLVSVIDGDDDRAKAAYQTLDTAARMVRDYVKEGRTFTIGLSKSAAVTPQNDPTHEAKCHQCGSCCTIKVATPISVYETGVYCPFIDKESKKCTVYERRFDVNPMCHPIDELFKIGAAPDSCGYQGTYKNASSGLIKRQATGLVKQLAEQMAQEVVKQAAQKAGVSLPFDIGIEDVMTFDNEPETLYSKLAAAIDLSDPAEELMEDVPTLLERQQEAAQSLRDNPAAGQMPISIEVERAQRTLSAKAEKKVKSETMRADRAALAAKLPYVTQEDLRTGTWEGMAATPDPEVKAAYVELVSRHQRYFTKQADTLHGPQLRAVIDRMEVDEDTTEQTLGRRVKNLSPELIVDVTKKLVAINQGKAETDDRDSLAFQRIMGPEDLFAERVERDGGMLGRRLLWKATMRSSAQSIPPGALSPQLRMVLLKSGLGTPLEEVNPMEIYDQLVRVTRMGEGGMPSDDAVPDESRNLQPSHFSFIDPSRVPESEKIGVDSRVAHRTYKGSDGNFYTDVINARTGQPARISAREMSSSIVAFPGEMQRTGKRVRAMVWSRQLKHVDRREVDYVLPHSSHMFTATSNLVPMVSGIKGGRLLMASKMITQALPLRDAEAPLVQNLFDEGTNASFDNVYGEKVGAIRAENDGVVQEITRDHVKVRYADGRTVRHELYREFPFNRKSYINSIPAVKVGDRVPKGGLLAKSNFTDNEGSLAIGKNLRVGYLAYRGSNADDAIVISESAAARLSSEHMYTKKLRPEENQEVSRRAFVSLFPGRFDKKQLSTIDENGVVKPGTVLKYGDPVILAVDKRKPRGRGVIRGRKTLFADIADTWDKESPGVVTDVDRMKGGWKVLVKAYSPMQVGDKLSGRYGNKGVVSTIIPDDQMPHDRDGNPMEVLLSPYGVVSRVNPAQLIETALGKVAKKTGRPFKLPGFTDESYVDLAKRELARAGLSDTEDLYDPKTGRKIPKVFTGYTYLMKLHHMAEPKSSGRDVGIYTSEGIPAGGGEDGSKRIGTGECNALISHGATELLRDAKVIRGQRNDDYWRALRLGYPPPSPKVPPVYEKFLVHLQGSGINLKKSGDATQIFAMTDNEVDRLSAGPITSPQIMKAHTLDPIEGGLFDPGKTGGHGGVRWSHVSLVEPMPNPVMEEPIRRLLGLTKKQFEDALAGKHQLSTGTGAKGLYRALRSLKLDDELARAEAAVRSETGGKRDVAVKRLGHLRTLKKMGIKPEQLMLSKVPVIPPSFRPITAFNKVKISSDANILYQDLIKANNGYRDVRKELGTEHAGDECLQLYKAFKAVTGLGDPISVKAKNENARGLLKQIFGSSSPKYGAFQRRVLGAAVDTVGRGVITPNPSLNMDQVGLPESKAWVIYRPFVMRNLVRRGMKALAAAEEISKQSDLARKALIDEMAKRPVVITRAPVLHKYGMMAAWPVLTKGNTLQIPPIVTSGFNADFDGNCVAISTKIVLTFVNLGVKLLSVSDIEREYAMKFTHDAQVVAVDDRGITVQMAIGDVPRVLDSARKDRNGADVYDVPAGLRCWSIDPNTYNVCMSPVTQLTIERVSETYRITTNGGLEVTASSNESLRCYDHDEAVTKAAAADETAVGKIVPVARVLPVSGGVEDFELGWLIGAFVSDGWVSGNTIGYAKLDAAKRARFAAVVKRLEAGPYRRTSHKRVTPGEGDYGENAKDHYYDTKWLHELASSCYGADVPAGKRAALYKCLPDLSKYGRQTLLGILTGLIDGDGSVSVNNSEKRDKPQTSVTFSTSSPYLVESVKQLCIRLGVRVGVTPYTPSGEGRKQAYMLTLSIVDIATISDELQLTSVGDCARLRAVKPAKDDRDIVPIPTAIMSALASKTGPLPERWRSYATIKSRRKPYYYMSRKQARAAIAALVERGADLPQLGQWRELVEADDVHWQRVKSVEPAGPMEVYDMAVETGVFVVGGGLVVEDTMNYHVPVSDEAVRDAVNKMLPSRNLRAVRDFDVHYYPRQEFLHGLHLASTARGKGVKTFVTKADALAAYRRGELGVGDQIQIMRQS